jgi:signal transduction histidine kinase
MSYFFKIASLLFLISSIACQSDPAIKTTPNQSVKADSIALIISQGRDKSKTIDQRMLLINTAIQLSEKYAIDSLRAKSLKEKTYLLGKSNQYDSAILYTKDLLELSRKNNDSNTIGTAFFKLGIYNAKVMKLDSAYLYYSESIKVQEALKDSLTTGKRLLNLAILLCNSGSYNQSDQMALEGLRFLENTKDEKTKASIYNCMAISAKKQKEYNEALYWYDLAIKTTDNQKNLNIYQSNTANIYRDQGQYQESIDIITRLLENNELDFNESQNARIQSNLAISKWYKDKDMSAEADLLEALEVRIKNNNIGGQVHSHDLLARFYLDHDVNKSKFHAQKGLDLAADLNNVDDQLEHLALLMKASENETESYSGYARQYIKLEDSIRNVRNSLSNKFAKIRYDSDKNRSENVSLKTSSLQRELALEKSNRINLLFLAAGLILVLTFVYIYLLLRSRYKKEKLEQIYLTETRISKKVHDEVANDLYKVMTGLEKSTRSREVILDDLEDIYEKTRDISRENNSLDLKQDFKQVLNDLLQSFQSEEVHVIVKGLSKINWNKIDVHKKTAIYRVVQELMTNMHKHSKASLVVLQFKTIANKINFNYRDDGIGWSSKKNNGLLNVENRIATIGGTINFESEKGKGFNVNINV